MCSLVHIGKENTGLLTLKWNHLTRKPTRKPLPPLEFDECYSHHDNVKQKDACKRNLCYIYSFV